MFLEALQGVKVATAIVTVSIVPAQAPKPPVPPPTTTTTVVKQKAAPLVESATANGVPIQTSPPVWIVTPDGYCSETDEGTISGTNAKVIGPGQFGQSTPPSQCDPVTYRY